MPKVGLTASVPSPLHDAQLQLAKANGALSVPCAVLQLAQA